MYKMGLKLLDENLIGSTILLPPRYVLFLLFLHPVKPIQHLIQQGIFAILNGMFDRFNDPHMEEELVLC